MSEEGGLSEGRALLWGTLIVGTADIVDAFIFFGLRGTRPVRILQGIASGLLGREAFGGGAATAALGAVLHYFIAFVIVWVFLAASRRLPDLARRPWLYGPLYGLVVYAVMNYVVIPLSLVTVRSKPLAVLANGLLIHMLGVGLTTALIARARRAT
ncbi:MAG: hypothetical protein ACM3OH_09305 [Bacillota bacterium]|jgi:hypothetical protein